MGESPTSTPYEYIPLEAFEDNLRDFHKAAQAKIMGKIRDTLVWRPYEYPMLMGSIVVKGVKLWGLRHMKVGVAGLKGGAYVLYRICEECKKNEYHTKSGVQCEFCDDEKSRHLVLFDTRPRSFDYDR